MTYHRITPHIKHAFLVAALAGALGSALARPPTMAKLMLRRIRQGEPVSEEEQLTCRNELQEYWHGLSDKHGVGLNFLLPDSERTRFFITAVRTAIVDPIENGGWPFRSQLRRHVAPELRKMITDKSDPFLAFCAIFPALDTGMPGFAVYCLEQLIERDPFLAKLAVEWLFTKYMHPKSFFNPLLAREDHEKVKDVLAFIEVCAPVFDRTINYIGTMTWFYRKCSDRTDPLGEYYRGELEALIQRFFPEGLAKVDITDFSKAPEDGVFFVDESTKMWRVGLRSGMVIVAVDGYRLKNMEQYIVLKELDAENPSMDLIVWDGRRYQPITVVLGDRLFGAVLSNYTVGNSKADKGSED